MTVTMPRVSDGGDNVEPLLCMRSLRDDTGGTCYDLLGKPLPLDRVSCLIQHSGRTVQEMSPFPTTPHRRRHASLGPYVMLPGAFITVVHIISHTIHRSTLRES